LPHCFSEVFEARAGEDRERRLWQPTRYPVQIETQGFWQVKLDYLHANPCRKGLVTRPQDWRFSSASFWYPLSSGPVPVNDVVLTPIYW
jgi:hypothetical protein